MSTIKKISFSFLLILLLLHAAIPGASAMAKVKYLAKFETQNAICFAIMNGMDVAYSGNTSSGTVSTGFNATPLLENGLNDITIWFGPAGINDGTRNFSEPTSCTFELSAVTQDKSLLLTSVSVEADKDLAPTGKKSAYYDGTDLTSPVSEREVPNTTAYEVTRTVTLKELPQWAWTTATPFEPTPENMQKLKDAYLDIWMAMDRKDLSQMKELTKLSVEEEAKHEELEPDFYFSTYNFDQHFEESKGGIRPNFADFSLRTYRGGRIVRLEDEYGNSPIILKLTDDPEGPVWVYKPYLSLIDGKIVISR